MLAINFLLVPRTSVFNASATTGAETPGEADVVDMGGGRFFFAYGNDYDQGTGGDSAGLRYEVHRRGDSTPVSSGSLDTPNDQSDVALTTFSNTVAAVFTTKEFNPKGEIYLQIFDALGVPAFPAQDLPSTAASDVNSNPDIARLTTGNFVVVWNSVDSSGNSDAEVRIVNATAVNAVAPFEITGAEFGPGFDASVQVRNPVVAALDVGQFAVAYQYNVNQGGTDGLAWAVYDGRTLLRTPQIINSIGQNDQAAITALTDGGFAIAHRNTISGDENVYVGVLNADGSIRQLNVLAHAPVGTAGNQFEPTITPFENGYFLVSWTSDVGFTESINARLFDSNGNGVGPVLTIASSIFGHVGQSALETTFPESFMAAWSDTNTRSPQLDSPDSINAQEFDFVRRVESDDAADTLDGYGLRDDMFGNGGNDRLVGRGGGDNLDGGTGLDTAVYSGLRSQYTITPLPNGSLLVQGGADGVDIVRSVEYLQFADITLGLRTPGNVDGLNGSDFMWQHSSGQAAVWLLNGTSLMSGVAVGPNVGPSWHLRGDGDFNADGRSDFLWQDNSGQAAVWLMNGTSLITGAAVGPNVGPSWRVTDAGDFNGDGNDDILWQNDSGQAAIWLMNGMSLITGAAVGPNPGPSWHVINTADFNGDTKSDILWQDNGGQAAIWLMNGTSLISGAAVGPNPGPSWHVIDSGDFNGDGRSDILWQNNSGQAAIWLMNGMNLISGTAVGPNPGPSWHAKASGDFNGDFKSDILWQNDNGQAAVWLMDGTNVIGGGAVGASPGADWHLIA